MDAAAQVRDTLRDAIIAAAGPREWGDPIGALIERAARELGISARAAKRLYYRETKTVPAHTYLEITQRIAAIEERRRERENRRNELDRLRCLAGGTGRPGSVVGLP